MPFADYFSQQAAEYARYRPLYPAALFDFIASIAPRHDRAWDVGTGSGQAALSLARRFKEVIATDPSANQLAHALPQPRVTTTLVLAEIQRKPVYCLI
jgi:trans-aconitate methyltransferase